MKFEPNCRATGIGSVPYVDINRAWDSIKANFPEIPYWPQLPKLRKTEEMNFQYIESFPGLSLDNKKLIVDTDSLRTAEELDDFYVNVRDDDLDFFRISEEHSLGLWSMGEALGGYGGIKAVKGQMFGPVSFGLQATDQNLNPIIYNDILRDVLLNDIRNKARWLESKMRSMSDTTIILFDEPYLSFVGSAFSNLKKKEVGLWLNRCMESLHGLKGIHCCSNTDWGFLMGLDIDIVSFDAYQYGDRLVLYGNELEDFLSRDGIIAWGIIPTDASELERVTVDDLFSRLRALLDGLEKKGIARDQLLSRSLITPACGLGSVSEALSDRAHSMSRELSVILRERYGLA